MTTAASDRLSRAQGERRSRADAILDRHIDDLLSRIGLSEDDCVRLSEADTVGPDARHKLRGILRHYAKEKKPFTACVRDNRKRFGPRVNAVCAVLKDIIRGTTKWRGNPALDVGSPGAIAASDDLPAANELLDDDVVALLENVNREELDDLLAEIEIIELEGADAFSTLTYKQRKKMASSAFVFPKTKGYPVHDHAHRVNALARASGKPEYSAVKAEVCKREPGLPACQKGKNK